MSELDAMRQKVIDLSSRIGPPMRAGARPEPRSPLTAFEAYEVSWLVRERREAFEAYIALRDRESGS